jgi:regulator of sigma E protease
MLIIILVVIGLSALILGHEAGHFFVARFFKMKIDEFGFGFPPRISARKRGDVEYSINWLPFGGFVKIAGENADPAERVYLLDATVPESERQKYFMFQAPWRRSLVILAGITVNFILGWVLLTGVAVIGTPQAVIVSGVDKNSPASTAGFLEGDVVRGFATVENFIAYVDANKGKDAAFKVLRDGHELALHATARLVPPSGQGPLGVALVQAGNAKQPLFPAIWGSLKQAVFLSWYTLQGLYMVLKNLILHGSLIAGVVGPVGIFSVASEAGSVGLVYLLQLLALISINLAVVNLIPFPALDGGRFIMILIEKMKGSPIPRQFEAWVNGLGFVALVILMALLTVHDVSKWF